MEIYDFTKPRTIKKHKAYWTEEKRLELSKTKKTWHAENPEIAILHSENMKAFFKDHPEILVKMSETKKAWIEENPEVMLRIVENLGSVSV